MRHLFREYLDTRLRAYEKLPDLKAFDQELARAKQMKQDIWSDAVAFSTGDPTQNIARLLLPALNEIMSPPAVPSRAVLICRH
jgi:hypothetical protein